MTRWPLAFAEARKPLAIGIDEEIIAAYGAVGGARRPYFDALRWWCGSDQYLEAVAQPGSLRHGLDGVPVGPVSDEHRAAAVTRLAERKARQAGGVNGRGASLDGAGAPARGCW
jgi:sRNA-binding protein